MKSLWSHPSHARRCNVRATERQTLLQNIARCTLIYAGSCPADAACAVQTLSVLSGADPADCTHIRPADNRLERPQPESHLTDALFVFGAPQYQYHHATHNDLGTAFAT